jgi:hypothetical protein
VLGTKAGWSSVSEYRLESTLKTYPVVTEGKIIDPKMSQIS